MGEEGKMDTATACKALQDQKRLQISYDGFNRVVEVHAVGFTKERNAVMRVYQVRGGSAHNERVGWKLLRLDETRGLAILDEASEAPRRGYRSGDSAMARIICQI